MGAVTRELFSADPTTILYSNLFLFNVFGVVVARWLFIYRCAGQKQDNNNDNNSNQSRCPDAVGGTASRRTAVRR